MRVYVVKKLSRNIFKVEIKSALRALRVVNISVRTNRHLIKKKDNHKEASMIKRMNEFIRMKVNRD